MNYRKYRILINGGKILRLEMIGGILILVTFDFAEIYMKNRSFVWRYVNENIEHVFIIIINKLYQNTDHYLGAASRHDTPRYRIVNNVIPGKSI